MKNIFKIINLILLIVILSSCEDNITNGYVEDYVVDALILVDRPIENITIMRTQPIGNVFNYDSSMVRDAKVIIYNDNQSFELQFRDKEDGSLGYYYPDTTLKIKSETEYKLKITLNNGKVITGQTTTPPRTEWTIFPKDFYQYPLDTIKLPATDSIAWKKVQGYDFYLVSITNLDTLNYGQYLSPPTDELNRRRESIFSSERSFREISIMSPVANNKTPVVWNFFRWFGKHEVTLYVPDFNYLRWYLQVQAKAEADPLLTTVEGAYGYFGSASVLQHEFFLLKNQP